MAVGLVIYSKARAFKAKANKGLTSLCRPTFSRRSHVYSLVFPYSVLPAFSCLAFAVSRPISTCSLFLSRKRTSTVLL